MNIKALPSVGSAFFVAFVLWSRRFAVPLQKESLGGALGGALVSSAPTKLYCSISCYVGVHLATLVYHLLRWCTTCYVGVPLATLVHLRQVHPLKAPMKVANKL